MSKVHKTFLAVFFMIIFSFLLLEIFLRITDPLGVEYFSEVVRYFNKLEKKENYSYIHPIGMNEKFQNVFIKTNSFGLRGQEFTKSKPLNTKRLLILGDSVVLGWGVDYENTFSRLLQTQLEKEQTNIEVIPIGVSSWNTRTEYEYFSRVAIDFDPDILLLIIVGNDTDPKDNSNIEIGKEILEKLVYRPPINQNIFKKTWFKLVDSSYFFRHIQYGIKILTEKDKNLNANQQDMTWQDSCLALQKMIKLCEENKILFMPFLYTDEESSYKSIFSLYRNFFIENKISFRTFPTYLFSELRYRNSIVDNHPNSEGHKIIAEIIYQNLQMISY